MLQSSAASVCSSVSVRYLGSPPSLPQHTASEAKQVALVPLCSAECRTPDRVLFVKTATIRVENTLLFRFNPGSLSPVPGARGASYPLGKTAYCLIMRRRHRAVSRQGGVKLFADFSAPSRRLLSRLDPTCSLRGPHQGPGVFRRADSWCPPAPLVAVNCRWARGARAARRHGGGRSLDSGRAVALEMAPLALP
jgi:hypothetical protein